MNCKIYVALKLTGRKAGSVNRDDAKIKRIFKKKGLTVLSPWDHEKHKYKWNDTIQASPADLTKAFWPRDKQLIREAHVLCDTTGYLFSRGAGMETGMTRYGLMRPTVWIDTVLFSVRTLEGDLVVANAKEAAKEIAKKWGTPWKRRMWRLKTVWNPRCIFNRVVDEIRGWR